LASADELRILQEKVAVACRILAMHGLAEGITGHVSARVPDSPGEMFIRCRGDDEYGVLYTDTDSVRRVNLDGSGPGLDARHERPLELPIHGELLRARPEMNAVVHGHPTSVLLCGMAGVDLKPVYGSYDPSGLGIAMDGVPVFPRSVLIRTPDLGQALAAALGSKSVCILRGHGIAVVGRSVEEAVLKAIRLERLADVCWRLANYTRGALPEIPAEDQAAFADRPTGASLPRGEEWTWRYYVRQLEEREGRSE
jgi:ribulose-5-phosphate 4-epimerase/fuculose-1-phosphate aldolase